MSSKWGVLAVVMLSIGCHSNPYAGISGKLSATPIVSKPGLPNYSIDAPALVDVAENNTVPVSIRGFIVDAVPVFAFDMPSWATFDPSTGQLSLAPKTGDAADPAHPTDTSRAYLINITLSSSTSPVATAGKSMVVVVHHQAQGLTVSNFDPLAKISEGTSYQVTITITSPDYPTGPFYPSSSNLPAGVTIAATADPTQFLLSYSPSFATVKVSTNPYSCYDTNSDSHLCNDLKWDLNILDPRGALLTKSAQWVVMDIRQNPLVVSPGQISATAPTADFYVQVEDPNGETVPEVSVDTPDAGQVNVTPSATKGGDALSNPYTMVHVVWSGMDVSTKGTTQTLNINSCVLDNASRFRQCVTTPISIAVQ